MKTLICGDIHTKTERITSLVDNVLYSDKEISRIVFLGDYADEWGVDDIDIIQALEAFATWVQDAREHGYEVTCLLGNHDYAYWIGSRDCSGNRPWIREDVVDALSKLKPQVATTVGEYLCTHAGVTSDWARNRIGLRVFDMNVQEVAEAINTMHNEVSRDRRFAIFECGPGRGAWGLPGPVWADIRELYSDYLDLPQIVGHTPVTTVTHLDADGRDLWFCDTHSLTPKMLNIGDDTMLVVDDNNRCEVVTGDEILC